MWLIGCLHNPITIKIVYVSQEYNVASEYNNYNNRCMYLILEALESS